MADAGGEASRSGRRLTERRRSTGDVRTTLGPSALASSTRSPGNYSATRGPSLVECGHRSTDQQLLHSLNKNGGFSPDVRLTIVGGELPVRSGDRSGNRRMLRSLVAPLVFVMLTVASAISEEVREITWDDLVPAASPLDDPFAQLTMDQRDELAWIAELRADKRTGFITESDEYYYKGALEATRKLKSEGIDVEALLAKAEELNAEIDRRNHAVVGELEGQMIRMSGYALPLEYTQGGVKEFLLVPYVGACIHVPPPPPNQIVFVHLEHGFVADNPYVPVWITGRMTIQQANRSLSFVDGESDVATGYTLDGIVVEPYKE
jgi:uncharacterized protein